MKNILLPGMILGKKNPTKLIFKCLRQLKMIPICSPDYLYARSAAGAWHPPGRNPETVKAITVIIGVLTITQTEFVLMVKL